MVKPAHFENSRGGLIQPTATTSSVTRMKRSLRHSAIYVHEGRRKPSVFLGSGSALVVWTSFRVRWRGRLDATSRVRSLPPEPLSVCVPTPLLPLATVPGVFPSYFPASRCPADDGRSQTLPCEG